MTTFFPMTESLILVSRPIEDPVPSKDFPHTKADLYNKY